jgi:hypothetical protein
MSETQQQRAGPETPYEPPERSRATGWVGMIFFASIMLIMGGTFQFLQGLVAVINDEYYLVTRNELLIKMDFTVWGWIHMLIGVAALAAAFGLLLGKTWARTVAIIIAGFSALANIGFLAAYPIWSTFIITLDILAIYAISVHGREVRY